MKKILVVTNNADKVKEIKRILSDYQVFSLEDLDLDLEVAETGSSYAENAILKVEAIQGFDDYLIMADDSGIEVLAMPGELGIRSARFGGSITQDEKNQLILQRLKNVTNRKARYVCWIALKVDNEVLTFDGYLEGEITEFPSGNQGFGYDPIFYLPRYKKTTGELSKEEKSLISHRYQALLKVKEYLEK